MDKKIVWKKPDGRIVITTPNREHYEQAEDEAAYLDAVAAHAKSVDPNLADAVRVADIDGEHHRTFDRTFRDAWTWTTPEPVIDVCMVKAREIHKNRLRELRAPKLAALDVEYVRAHERGDTKAQEEIVKRKQALRDITSHPGIEAATDTEQLKAVIPDALY